MYTVYNESDVNVFTGTLNDCYDFLIYIGEADFAEFYILDEDGNFVD